MAESVSGNKPGNRRREAIRAAVRRPAKTLHLKAPRSRQTPPRATVSEPTRPATIFVSYSREDIETVRTLVERLRTGGLAVTWDQDFSAGIDFERGIRDTIDRVSSVIVVWSPASVQSHFVRDEARRALRAAKLITTHVVGFDVSDVPLGFGYLHVIPIDDQPGLLRSLAQHGITRQA